jgi:pimeloyl-ACP methyl ester carboxylesterase
MVSDASSQKITVTIAALSAFVAASQAPAQTSGGAVDRTPPGRYADVNGISLYYEVHGSGKPLVLLHGGLGAIEMFGPVLPTLAAGRQVIAVDLQGHGRTADIDRPLRPELMADDVAALVRHLGIGPADVMGYSLGGGVALHTAIRHPDVVDRLVVISTVLRRDAYYPEILEQQAFVNAAAADAMRETPMYQLYSSVAPRPEAWPRLLDKIGVLMKEDFDFGREIGRIEARTLIVAADADLFPPSQAVEHFAHLGGGQRDGGWDGSGRPASSLAILPGLTHYDIFSDPALAATVVRFLEETEPTSP